MKWSVAPKESTVEIGLGCIEFEVEPLSPIPAQLESNKASQRLGWNKTWTNLRSMEPYFV